MARKTRKHHIHKKNKNRGVQSIPELRRSFEHISQFVDDKIHHKESHDKIVKDLRKEWLHVFMKELDKKSADAYVNDRTASCGTRRRTLRKRGGASPLAGAPIDYITRPGMYLAQGTIPTATGHLPLSGNQPSNFGSYLSYVSNGFQVGVPEIAQQYDPVAGQTKWPQVPVGMGSNTIQKGGQRKPRRGGGLLYDKMTSMGATISQAYNHPMGSSSPPGVGQDVQDLLYGRPVGPSPDQVQRQVQYHIGNTYPKPVQLL